VTKSPNGTRLTKGDYGYGVPMVAKPQETFSAVPWGTDPISQVMQFARRPLTFDDAPRLSSRVFAWVYVMMVHWTEKKRLAGAPPV
jgi:hypothetical protein